MDDRLIELETKVAFQEDSIQKLTEAVNQHERELYRLTREMKMLREHATAQSESQLAELADEPPPPHY
jgi:SlyX protein